MKDLIALSFLFRLSVLQLFSLAALFHQQIFALPFGHQHPFQSGDFQHHFLC